MPNNIIFEIDIDGYIKGHMGDPIGIECGCLVTFNYVDDNRSCTYYTKQRPDVGWCWECELAYCADDCPRSSDGRHLCMASNVVFTKTSNMMEEL